MGLSFSKSFLKYELIKPENLHLITRNQSKIQKISEEFPKSKISLFENLNAIDADLIIIAVKPQDFQNTAENIQFSFKENQMILSIMAGIKIEKIQKFEKPVKLEKTEKTETNRSGIVKFKVLGLKFSKKYYHWWNFH